jgi:hypothetical protein
MCGTNENTHHYYSYVVAMEIHLVPDPLCPPYEVLIYWTVIKFIAKMIKRFASLSLKNIDFAV